MKNLCIRGLAVVFGVLGAGEARAQCGLLPDVVLGGQFTHVAALPDRRIVTVNGSAIELYGLADPAAPRLLDRVIPGDQRQWWAPPQQLVAAGRLVYATMNGAVAIYDTAGDQLRLTAIHHARDGAGPFLDICSISAEVNRLYAAGVGHLEVVDTTTPETPVVLGRSTQAAWTCPLSITSHAGYVYEMNAGNPSRVDAVNTSTFAAASTSTFASCYKAVVGGDFLFLRRVGGPGVGFYRLTNPMAPQPLGEIPANVPCDASNTPSFVSSGNFVFTVRNNQIEAYNVTNPVAATLVGSTDPSLGFVSIAQVDSGLLVGTARNGILRIMNVSSPSAMTQAAEISNPWQNVSWIARWERTLWAVVGGTQLQGFDVTDPLNPVPVGHLIFPATIDCLKIAGGIAHVLYNPGQGYQLRLVDVHDAHNPVLRGSLAAPFLRGQSQAAAAAPGIFALKGPQNSRVTLINTTNASAPVQSSIVTAAGNVRSVVLSGSLLFISDGGLRIFDVSMPTAPFEVSSTNFPEFHWFDVMAVGGTTLVGSSSEGNGVFIDVSHPTHPAIVNQSWTTRTWDLISAGASFATSGTELLDASDPAHPFARLLPAPGVTLPAGGSLELFPDAMAVSRADGSLSIHSLDVDHKPEFRVNILERQRPCYGEPFDLTVDAVGRPGNVTYQWYRDDISNPLPSETGPTLHIPRFTSDQARNYFVIASNGCGSTRNTLSALQWQYCVPDFTCDGFVDFLDFGAFIDAFETGNMKSDVNGDDFLDFFDFTRFIVEFEDGC